MSNNEGAKKINLEDESKQPESAAVDKAKSASLAK